MNNIQPFNVVISDRKGKIFIDNSQLNHIANSVFTGNGPTVKSITMDGFIEENQIEFVGLLKLNIEVAERLLIDSFEKISNVKYVATSCHVFCLIVSATGNFKEKNPSFAF